MAEEASPVPAVGLLDNLKAQYVDFSDILASESNRRNVSYISEGAGEKLNVVEERQLAKQSFGDDLKFSVDVNLSGSKKAFRVLLSGLENKDDFLGLWNLRPHDPLNYPHPLGEVEPGILDGLKGGVMTGEASEEVIPPAR